MPDTPAVFTTRHGPLCVIHLHRPARRNAVDKKTAQGLFNAFQTFDNDPALKVAILYGEGGVFCAGADLKAIAEGQGNRLSSEGPGPMGPTRMRLTKPTIAAIEGYAVAGGLELALWCDLRVAAEGATFSVACRRWGVPLIDGGTVRLPRVIGMGRAMDLILTGREVASDEALSMGLISRRVDTGQALAAAIELGEHIAQFPQDCMNTDRQSAYEQWDLPLGEAILQEFLGGERIIKSGVSTTGAQAFSKGKGRHHT